MGNSDIYWGTIESLEGANALLCLYHLSATMPASFALAIKDFYDDATKIFDTWRVSSMYQFSMQALSFRFLSRHARSDESPNFCLIRILKSLLPVPMLPQMNLCWLQLNLRGYQKTNCGCMVWLLYKITFHERVFVTTKVSELVNDSFSFSITLATVILSSDFLISIQPNNVNFLIINLRLNFPL